MKTYTKILVTAENLEEIREAILALDQRREIQVGQTISTWPIFYRGGQRGQVTVWHDTDRAAVDQGGDSLWGDWIALAGKMWINGDNGHLLYPGPTLEAGGRDV